MPMQFHASQIEFTVLLLHLQLKVEKKGMKKKSSQEEAIYFFINRTPFQRLSFVCSGRDEICTKHKRNKVSVLGIVRALPTFPVKSQFCTGNNNHYWAFWVSVTAVTLNTMNTTQKNILKLLIKPLSFSAFEKVLGEFLTKEGSNFNERDNGKYIE